ncbi:MAG: DUF2071 domain-containing protein [Phycisphaeraceae bacterium]|nr:DUF2071 domain-containing protein [Phycisphaeraceae bacterium]
MKRPFLTARWTDLVLAQYDVDDALLEPHLAPGLTLDRFEGRAYVSLVAFDFRDTRVRGVRIPGHTRFPEVNLRFYVRDPATGIRGVMFIRELVPRRLVAWVARAIYNEPYRASPMRSTRAQHDQRVTVEHTWRFGASTHRVRACGTMPLHTPDPESREHFFKEHSWGFGKSRSGRRLIYRVEHPVWAVYAASEAEISVDFARVYGPAWSVLNGRSPDSIVFAAGSSVSVSPVSSASA